MGLFRLFSDPPAPNQNPQGQRPNSRDPWARSDSSRNAPDETRKSRRHTRLCVNNGYLAKEAGFKTDFGIQVDTHAKIRKWVSKVMCFTVFMRFSKQNAQDISKSKTKHIRQLQSHLITTYMKRREPTQNLHKTHVITDGNNLHETQEAWANPRNGCKSLQILMSLYRSIQILANLCKSLQIHANPCEGDFLAPRAPSKKPCARMGCAWKMWAYARGVPS